MGHHVGRTQAGHKSHT